MEESGTASGYLVARSTYKRRNCLPVDEAGLTGPRMLIATLAKGSVESLVMPMGTFGTRDVEVDWQTGQESRTCLFQHTYLAMQMPSEGGTGF